MKKSKMISKINKIKSIFEDIDESTTDFIDVKTEDGLILRVEVLEVGQAIVEITEDGEVEVEDNDYVLEDGRTLVVEAGKIVEIIEKEEDESTEDESTEEFSKKGKKKFAEIEAVYKWTLNVSADQIEIGTELKEVGEDGEEYNIEAGEYELEDGRKIQVSAESIVVLISDKDGDVEDVIDNVDGEESNEEESSDEEFSKILIEELKSVVSQFNEMKKEIRTLKTDNRKMKRSISNFSKSPSANHTDTELNFSKSGKNNDSMIHRMFGK